MEKEKQDKDNRVKKGRKDRQRKKQIREKERGGVGGGEGVKGANKASNPYRREKVINKLKCLQIP